MNCKFCNRPVTWDTQKYTFGHLIVEGYSTDVAKSFSPSHVKCAKQEIKKQNIQKENVVKQS